MGRPLNKRFFASGVGATIGCTVRIGGANFESAIISQKSISQFRVAGEGATPLTGASLIFVDANPDTIADNGASWADFTLTFSAGDSIRVASSESNANDGVYEIDTVIADLITLTDNGVLVANADDTTATLALVSSVGVLARLVEGVPTVDDTMQVTVTPELSQAGAQATVTFTVTAGAITNITSFFGGFGYFTPGTAVVVAGGGADGTVDTTVANGVIQTMVINAGGSGYSDSTQDIADNPAATAPVENAKIINARTVKTFEGNIYQWPAAGGEGTPEVRSEADLQSTDL